MKKNIQMSMKRLSLLTFSAALLLALCASCSAQYSDRYVVPPNSNAGHYKKGTFSYFIKFPDEWKVEQYDDADSFTVCAEEPDERGVVCVIAVHLDKKYPIEEFIAGMEIELAKEPFFTGMQKVDKAGSLPEYNNHHPDMVSRQYTGIFEKEKIRSLVGYLAKEPYGYTIVTLRAGIDSAMEDILRQSMQSFQIIEGNKRERK